MGPAHLIRRRRQATARLLRVTPRPVPLTPPARRSTRPRAREAALPRRARLTLPARPSTAPRARATARPVRVTRQRARATARHRPSTPLQARRTLPRRRSTPPLRPSTAPPVHSTARPVRATLRPARVTRPLPRPIRQRAPRTRQRHRATLPLPPLTLQHLLLTTPTTIRKLTQRGASRRHQKSQKRSRHDDMMKNDKLMSIKMLSLFFPIKRILYCYGKSLLLKRSACVHYVIATVSETSI